MKPPTCQHCSVSSMRVSFSVKTDILINSNILRRLYASGSRLGGPGYANSLAGNCCFLGKDKKVLSFSCRSHPDEDFDRISVVEESKETDNSVSDDAAFLLKLVAVSFAGGALIKYGSLFSSIPFTPSPIMAVSIVMFPPLAFAIWMISQGESGAGNEE
eukprot:jgi/Picsp_1/179/NSC_00179-R1_predicted protein [Chlamydomonas reinhardtii]